MPKILKTKIRLEALLTERLGMEWENAQRAQLGESIAYTMNAFEVIKYEILDLLEETATDGQ
jgi:hypothetical protein